VTTLFTSTLMAQLMSLPNELLTQILKHCDGVAHPNALYNLLFTCKALCLIAKDIICRHIYLSASKYSDSRLERFLDRGYANNKIASIRLQFEMNLLLQFRYSSIDAFNGLEPFYPRLRGFEKLTTFSLNQKGHTGFDIVLPSSIVYKVLANLPRSVTNLELDTSGCKDRPEIVSRRAHDLIDIDMSRYQHICSQIGRLMAQLKCLRLRVPRLCSEIFRFHEVNDRGSRPTFPLQVIMIRLDPIPSSDMSRMRTTCCTHEAQFCDDLGLLVQRGHCPDIKVFRVAYWQPGEGIIRDLAEGGLTDLSWHRYGGDGKDLFVSDVERGISWTEYPNGTRRPEFMGRSGPFSGDSSEVELRGR
jgi:hypothetical protein